MQEKKNDTEKILAAKKEDENVLDKNQESLKEESNSKAGSIDDVLQLIGTGKWNIYTWVVVGLVYGLIPPNVFWGAFVTPSMNHTCIAPQSATTLDQCNYFFGEDNSTTFPCQAWDYNDQYFSFTLTNQLNLVCGDAYLRAALSSAYMIGSIFGAPFGGYLSDKFGRRQVLVISVAVFTIINLSMNWLPWLAVIFASRFILGALHPVIVCAINTLIMEVCEMKFRSALGSFNSLPWSIVTLLYGGLAYLIKDYRWLQSTMALLGVLILPLLWFIDESPRWLVVNGKIDDAVKVIQRAASWNNEPNPSEFELRRIFTNIEQTKSNYTTRQNGCQKIISELSLLMDKAVRSRVLKLWYIFLVTVMVYYGISLSGGAFNVNPFLFMALSGLIEMPSNIITLPLIQKWGRRVPLAVTYGICASAILGLLFTPEDSSAITMTLAMIGKFTINTSIIIMFLYIIELLPTEIRSTGLGIAMFVSRISSSTAPFIVDSLSEVLPWAPSVIFGVSSLIAGFVTLRLPETKDRLLVDTVNQLKEEESNAV